jgi:hypothetical protein
LMCKPPAESRAPRRRRPSHYSDVIHIVTPPRSGIDIVRSRPLASGTE